MRPPRFTYDIFGCNGILFNHESPRRGETFVTRKITRGIARIKAGLDKKLYLGNLEAKRDWGFAPEYVECQWLMMQQDKPDDYVIGSGECYSVQDFVEAAFGYLDMDWHDYVEIDPVYYRPTEVDILRADITKAKTQLDWTPRIDFHDLVRIMVDADFRAHDLEPPGAGEKALKAKGIPWILA